GNDRVRPGLFDGAPQLGYRLQVECEDVTLRLGSGRQDFPDGEDGFNQRLSVQYTALAVDGSQIATLDLRAQVVGRKARTMRKGENGNFPSLTRPVVGHVNGHTLGAAAPQRRNHERDPQ